MKRKQFHLSPVEELLLQNLSKDTGQSEAEVVREAIKHYGAKKRRGSPNPLIEMANQATADMDEKDLSAHHDKYLLEIFQSEE
ncbi:hypothetical protein D7Z54_28560 [Salibacterium salarium]|uniref:Ribbon-helix-helix protein, copG family n=1 Tax=Salibacterium salarium TaxID=284579 RepID=A0A3R9PG35_9BACI|nr:hypothetical protein [Salibacterium salarium]RSL29973.1 hypothetical protein D7Z54_28560 [Salibacterium salarium]